ncbi:hypothetical protein VTN00DRAFT_9617 [Thermoascus crustaceus]|uniref:uncharacterized protein n=1 Tax=Thermoascus crustaceus TaxID=5088 RepID=UPI0037438B9F
MPQSPSNECRRHTRFDLSFFDEDTESHQPEGGISTDRQWGERHSLSPSLSPVKPQKTTERKTTEEKGGVTKLRGGGLRPLRLVDAATQIPARLLKYKSPWETFQRMSEYGQEDDRFIKVQRKDRLRKVFALRAFSVQEFDRIEQRFKHLKHENILTAQGFFRLRQTCFVLSEICVLSLARVVAYDEYPTERELACIIGQTLRGLDFLLSKGIVHKSLSCSKVLLDQAGCIKIVGFTGTEMWHQDQPPTLAIKGLAMFALPLIFAEDISINKLSEDAFVDPKNWEEGYLVYLIEEVLDKTLPPRLPDPDEELQF